MCRPISIEEIITQYLLLLMKLFIFSRALARPSNIGLTFKSAPEQSEGLAHFLRNLLAKSVTKDL